MGHSAGIPKYNHKAGDYTKQGVRYNQEQFRLRRCSVNHANRFSSRVTFSIMNTSGVNVQDSGQKVLGKFGDVT